MWCWDRSKNCWEVKTQFFLGYNIYSLKPVLLKISLLRRNWGGGWNLCNGLSYYQHVSSPALSLSASTVWCVWAVGPRPCGGSCCVLSPCAAAQASCAQPAVSGEPGAAGTCVALSGGQSAFLWHRRGVQAGGKVKPSGSGAFSLYVLLHARLSFSAWLQ